MALSGMIALRQPDGKASAPKYTQPTLEQESLVLWMIFFLLWVWYWGFELKASQVGKLSTAS
jgi:hypothetical protein